MSLTDTIVLTGGLMVFAAVAWFFFSHPAEESRAAVTGTASTASKRGSKAILSIQGMTCAACVARVEKAALRVPGVQEAVVNLLANQGVVTFDPAKTTPQTIASAVSRIGYETSPADAQSTTSQPKDHDAAKFWVSAVLTLPILYGAMGSEAHLPGSGPLANGVVQWTLATAVLGYGGGSFFRLAAKAVAQRVADMNTLIALGTGSAYLYSMYALLRYGPDATGHLYYESAAVIVTLMLLGRLLEGRARGKTVAAIEGLLALQPKTASIVRGDIETTVPLSDVKPGDHVRVRPGERIPTDGNIVDGSGTVDESLMTGESIPVAREIGDAVAGGTLNERGSFVYAATRLGEASALAQIVRLVHEAQSTKAPVQRLADRVTAIFVPTVLLIAVTAFVTWFAIGHRPDLAFSCFISTLIIACPCALGLATPTSLTVGIGLAARLGVFIRDARTLEHCAAVTLVAFDKTGTLTEGRPVVSDVVPVFEPPKANWLHLVAAAEARSEHPLAGAVVAETARRFPGGLPNVEEFDSAAGGGISARVEGSAVVAGTREYLISRGVDSEPLFADAERLASEGKSVIFCAVDGTPAGLIAVGDPIKKNSAGAVSLLRSMGLKVALISGDLAGAAKAVGNAVGIDDVNSGVKPSEKAAIVREQMERGEVVAMVGDGVNDAPVLAAADIGIALGTGTDIAQEAAGITLSGGDPMGVATAIALARATLRNIKQNLTFAFGYNTLGIPLATGLVYAVTGHGLLSPMIAGAVMALSSISVVTNALRLRAFTPPRIG